jgi:hypothetical protein
VDFVEVFARLVIASCFEPTHLLNLPNYHIYLKLMIDGAPSKAFSGVALQSADGIKGGEPAEEDDGIYENPRFLLSTVPRSPAPSRARYRDPRRPCRYPRRPTVELVVAGAALDHITAGLPLEVVSASLA